MKSSVRIVHSRDASDFMQWNRLSQSHPQAFDAIRSQFAVGVHDAVISVDLIADAPFLQVIPTGHCEAGCNVSVLKGSFAKSTSKLVLLCLLALL